MVIGFIGEIIAIPFKIAIGIFRWWINWPLWIHYPLLPIYAIILLLIMIKLF